jgi:HSP20 family protein
MLPAFFSDFFDSDTMNYEFMTNSTVPAVNIKETKDDFVVEVAAPGMKKDDFKIELDNNLLMISSEKEEEHEEKQDGEYTRKEFMYQSFRRSFTVPKTIEDGKIDATYKDGVLSIHLPKKEEAKQKPKKTIPVG